MSAVSQFAGTTLLHGGNQSNPYEPQRRSNFALVIYGVGTDADTLILSCASTNIPEPTIREGQIKYFNETVKYAGSIAPFPDGTIKFNDYIDRVTLQSLSAWYQQVFNPATGAIGWAKDYKKTADILLLPPGMPDATAPGAVLSTLYQNRVWHITGAWPKVLKYDELDHADDGTKPAQIHLTIALDRCFPSFMVDPNSGGTLGLGLGF